MNRFLLRIIDFALEQRKANWRCQKIIFIFFHLEHLNHEENTSSYLDLKM